MTEWMPIETAPKDRTSVLLSMYVGRSPQWITMGAWTQTSTWYANTRMNGEITVGWHNSGGEPLRQPTHWQPLPEPPRG